jgi:DNA-binding MarR family transcriptional regulator
MKTDDLAHSPAYQLWLATNAWQRNIRRALEPIGVTHVQFVVLVFTSRLGSEGDPVSQAQVCRLAGIDANMMSDVVRSLESKSLVVRRVHPTDRRAQALELTESGRELLAKGRALAKPTSEAFFAPLGEETETLTRLLKTVVEAADLQAPQRPESH